MGKTLFIGSLSYKATEAELAELFGGCGAVVKTKILVHPATGESKGVGFVEMSTEDEARKAMEKLNGATLSGRKIFVSEAKPQEKKPGRFVGDAGFVERRSGKDRRRARGASGAARKGEKGIRKWSARPGDPGKKKPWSRQPKGRFEKKEGAPAKKWERKPGGSGPKKWARDAGGSGPKNRGPQPGG